ncbi:hypothetical protein [Salinimicrobium xinjiangense]|uniref:hypothetical protein n=1 Tax=Salinimicrobium xinjiangense TaxID=438596 RepID=UPI0003FC8EA6|nr:hypothetical protein [Salinimicrobium xinjiangense]
MNKYLKVLKENNPKIEIEIKDDVFHILNPWNDKSVSFVLKKGQRLSSLEHITFPEQLVALFNKNKSELEFIYGPIDKQSNLVTRSFDFIFKGEKFYCSFDGFSDSLKLIAKSFKENSTESQTDYRHLRFLRDLLTDNFYKDFFKETINTSFYVTGNFELIDFDFVGLSKSLNFYMSFFDRGTPKIVIHAKEYEEEKYKNPCLNELFDTFPKTINSTNIDSTLLDTFMVANQTENVRLKFIFYFQVLEYASYYYLDKKIQDKIRKTMNDPEIYDKSDYFSKTLIEELKDHFSQKDDSTKLEKTILENCSIKDIQNEIEVNKDFFSKDLEFEGGLKINRILKGEHAIENLKEGDLILIKNNIERIRNVLVHLRESRENKVILPSQKNNHKLLPYLYLIRRIAEKVAINFS